MSDTSQIILTIIGTGVALLGILASLIYRLDSRIDSLRQEMRADVAALRQELRTDIGALHARIDALYQALFNHKDPAA